MSYIYGSASGANVIYGKNNIGVAFGGAVAPFDDTDLKAYYRFNETSGNIINQSESDDTIGSSADIIMTGGTYNQSQLPFGYSLLFDGVDDLGNLGTSLSQWNFMHDTTAAYSSVFWIRFVSNANNEFVYGNIHTDDIGAGQYLREQSNQVLSHYETNGTLTIVYSNTATSYFANDTDYMISVTYDQSLSTLNSKVRINNGSLTTGNKTAATPSSGNAGNQLRVACKPDEVNHLGNFYMAEWSIWDRVLTDEELTSLYNGGSGRTIY